MEKNYKELRKENSRFWKDVMLEDVNAIEGMQAWKKFYQFIMEETFLL